MEMTKEVKAGQAVYSRTVLAVYDFYVFGLSNRFIWDCQTDMLIKHYDDNISGNHLEIGVGSGFLLDKCRFPVVSPNVALMDLNENSLEVTKKRIRRYTPVCYRRNVFESFPIGSQKYDSIGMNYLIHCLPGTMQSKAVVFDNALNALNPGGVVFGSTLVQSEVQIGRLARKVMSIYNRRGIFSNDEDGVIDLDDILSARFSQHKIQVRGCAAIFSARL